MSSTTQPEILTEPEYVDQQTAARMLNMSRSTWHRRRNDGRPLPPLRRPDGPDGPIAVLVTDIRAFSKARAKARGDILRQPLAIDVGDGR